MNCDQTRNLSSLGLPTEPRAPSLTGKAFLKLLQSKQVSKQLCGRLMLLLRLMSGWRSPLGRKPLKKTQRKAAYRSMYVTLAGRRLSYTPHSALGLLAGWRPGTQVHHLDGDPTNNSVTNLACGTRQQHASAHAAMNAARLCRIITARHQLARLTALRRHQVSRHAGWRYTCIALANHRMSTRKLQREHDNVQASP